VNTNDLTFDGYLRLPLGARLAEARTTLRHTADRWEEGEQHKLTFTQGHYVSPTRYFYGPDEQTALWDAHIYTTCPWDGDALKIFARHLKPDTATQIANILGRVVKINVVTRAGNKIATIIAKPNPVTPERRRPVRKICRSDEFRKEHAQAMAEKQRHDQAREDYIAQRQAMLRAESKPPGYHTADEVASALDESIRIRLARTQPAYEEINPSTAATKTTAG
jgi:hypothetical protein